MNIHQIKDKIPDKVFNVLESEGIRDLRPSQEKAINAGLFRGNSILVSTPTASGKTLVAELAAMNKIINDNKKAIYIVPLKALASEKFREFNRKYGHIINIGMSIGDYDSADYKLHRYNLIITTAEKLDSVIRHSADWLNDVGVVIIDEIHLLNDVSRGPTLEVLITILKSLIKAQFIGLSATIGNPKELAHWLGAKLVEDSWRPVKLHKGIYLDGNIEFF